MDNSIILPTKMSRDLEFCMNSDLEWAGLISMESVGNDFLIRDCHLLEQQENSASISFFEDSAIEFRAKGLEIMDVHTHSRKEGTLIKGYDPYWSVGKKRALQMKSGMITKDNFYISMQDSADSEVMEYLNSKEIIYALFVHPAYKTEGQLMSKDKICFTAFKYDPSSLGYVREIPLLIN